MISTLELITIIINLINLLDICHYLGVTPKLGFLILVKVKDH